MDWPDPGSISASAPAQFGLGEFNRGAKVDLVEHGVQPRVIIVCPLFPQAARQALQRGLSALAGQ